MKLIEYLAVLTIVSLIGITLISALLHIMLNLDFWMTFTFLGMWCFAVYSFISLMDIEIPYNN